MPITVGKCPVPFPHIGNNQNCRPVREIPYETMEMRCDVYKRLAGIPTISYSLKKCVNPCAPEDYLDRALTACYDQHRQFWAPKSQTVIQCETYHLFPYGMQQDRMCAAECFPTDYCNKQCAASSQPQISVMHEPRNHTSHLKCHVTGPHISNTARGFGRSVDGLFYNC